MSKATKDNYVDSGSDEEESEDNENKREVEIMDEIKIEEIQECQYVTKHELTYNVDEVFLIE